MADTDYRFDETPSWTGVDEFAVSFVFEMHIETKDKEVNPARAFRLESISRALDPDCPVGGKARSEEEQAACGKVYASLFDPVASYHDDITSGGPGRGGRPLVLLAEGFADDGRDESGDHVRLVRPETWTYRGEGVSVLMRAPADEGKRTLNLALRDSFFVFESGRIYYVLSVQPADAHGDEIDEYGLIQLLKLAHPHFGTMALRETLRFDYEGAKLTLVELAKARFDRFGKATGDAPQGMRDVMLKHVLEPKESLRTPGWDDLRTAVVGVRNADVYASFESVAGERDALGSFGAKLLEREETAAGESAPHIAPGYPVAGARALALAGLLQSVPDFPFQDSSEIWDSTRAIAGGAGMGYALFSHPRFVVEVAANWRSLADGREGIGHCPYLLLTTLVATHDEAIAREMEEALDLIIYGAEQEAELRAAPLKGVMHTLAALRRQFIPGPSKALRESLERRLDVFRRLSIHRSRHIFRYETEANTLASLNDKRGTTDRFDRATEILDRYESLVEDVQDMGRMASDQRLNLFLAIVAGLSIVSALSDLPDLDIDPSLQVNLSVLGGVLAFILLWIAYTKIRK